MKLLDRSLQVINEKQTFRTRAFIRPRSSPFLPPTDNSHKPKRAFQEPTSPSATKKVNIALTAMQVTQVSRSLELTYAVAQLKTTLPKTHATTVQRRPTDDNFLIPTHKTDVGLARPKNWELRGRLGRVARFGRKHSYKSGLRIIRDNTARLECCTVTQCCAWEKSLPVALHTASET
jgi:hypothetical protein